MQASRPVNLYLAVRFRPAPPFVYSQTALLEWRNWQTHGTQKPNQPGTRRETATRYKDFPSSGTSGNAGFPRNHYKNHYTITRIGIEAVSCRCVFRRQNQIA